MSEGIMSEVSKNEGSNVWGKSNISKPTFGPALYTPLDRLNSYLLYSCIGNKNTWYLDHSLADDDPN